MVRGIRSWEDGKLNYRVFIFWAAIVGLVWLQEQRMTLLAGVSLVLAGFFLRHPLRGLDVGRMIWGFYGVVILTLIWLETSSEAWRFPLQALGYVLFGYQLGAWERCRINRGLTTLLMLLTAGSFAVAYYWPAWAVPIVWGVLTLVTLVLVFLLPRAFMRAGLLLFSRTIYRLRVAREDSGIPDKGALILVANHVSFFDIAFILAVTPRPVRFLVDSAFYRRSWFRWYFNMLGFIEVPDIRRPKAQKCLFERIHHHLRNGEAIAFYPEGGVSGNGFTGGFRRGLERLIPSDVQVTVIPLRLGLYWGRLFAWDRNRLRYIPPLRWPIPVTVTVGEPIDPKMTPYQLWMHICEMGAEAESERQFWEYSLHTMFLQMTRQVGRRTVVFADYEGARIPNWEMATRALVLSRAIRRLDPGRPYVGVMLPGTAVAGVAMLGVMFADRTPALINFTAGPEAIAAAIRQARLKCILTSRKFLEKLKMEPLPEMVMLEDLAKTIPRGDKLRALFAAWCLPAKWTARLYAPESWNDVRRVAALLFTSGSSGKPKGVMLTHHNIASNVFSFWRVISWSRERDVLVGQMPLFHTFGLTVCFCFPAFSGTRVIYTPNPLDAGKICNLVRDEKVSLLIASPTFLQNYVRKAKPGDFDSLRVAITGAEKLRPEVTRQFEAVAPVTVTEGYGTTELSPIAAVNFAQSCFLMGKLVGKVGSIGQPLPGVAARTVDVETGEVLGSDEVGLLEIKGPNVMKGYLDEPVLTSKVIRDGWYSTGDMARIDSDGYIFITGRLSRFSKIGGEMVPHELIEQKLSELYPGETRHFAVTGCRDARRGERLLAFHNLDPAEAPRLVAGLREAGLPNLWIPKPEDFIRIDEIPVMASGKLDLQRLRLMAEGCAEQSSQEEA